MRLLLKFHNNKQFNPFKISRFEIQGFIYSLLKDTRFHYLHDLKGFKFFCFSNIFISNKEYTLIVSSPNSKLIKTMYYKIRTVDNLRLGEEKYVLINSRIINTPKEFNFLKTSTPVVLFHNQTRNNHCYSFKNDNINYNWFFNRLKENALKKYNAFYDDEYSFEEPLFNSFSFKREVAMNFERHSQKFLLIGSLWNDLTFDIHKDNQKFYRFIYDCGIGEKNSTGMGFLNNVR